jgi:DNA-binding MarR family transcriptional regulator
MRTPEAINSPPATVKKRRFFGSLTRFSKSDHRLSALFSDQSSSTAVIDTDELPRCPPDAVSDDRPEPLARTIVEKPPSIIVAEIRQDEANQPHLVDTNTVAVDCQVAMENQGAHDIEVAEVHLNGQATESTDTIVKPLNTSGEADADAKAGKPDVIDFGSPLDLQPMEPEIDVFTSYLATPSRRSMDYVELPAIVPDRPPSVESISQRVPVGLYRTSTQETQQLTGLRAIKPPAAVRLSKRVSRAGFGKWLIKRLRRVRHPRRQKKRELTRKNLEAIEHGEDMTANRKLRKVQPHKTGHEPQDMAGHEKPRAEALLKTNFADVVEGKNEERGKQDGPIREMDGAVDDDRNKGNETLSMLNGKVPDMSLRDTTEPHSPTTKNGTIGRRAVAWFRGQRNSVDLTRFLLNEMKGELTAAQ